MVPPFFFSSSILWAFRKMLKTRKRTLKFIIGGWRFSKIRVVKLGAYDSRSALYPRSPSTPTRASQTEKKKGTPISSKKEKPGPTIHRVEDNWGFCKSIRHAGGARNDTPVGLAGFRSIMPGIRNIIKATFQFNSDILKDIIKGQPTTQRRGH